MTECPRPTPPVVLHRLRGDVLQDGFCTESRQCAYRDEDVHPLGERADFGLVYVAVEDEVGHVGDCGHGGSVVHGVGLDNGVADLDGDARLLGLGIGDVGSVVMRDRRHLAEDGMIVVVMPYSVEEHVLIGEPEIVTRGFIYVKEAEALMEELKRVVLETTDACEMQHIADWTAIKSKVKSNLSGYLYKTMRRSPMILPVISEI